MKNGFSFLILTVISFYGFAQKANPKVVYETIIVYDTVTVYDTITIYDTIKTENKVQKENNFKNNLTAEKAYLAIDTTDFSAAVLLINKKDTATLSINSIILSEHTKNVDTMKKQLLTLLVSAALIQASFAQETGTLANPISSQSETSQSLIKDSLIKDSTHFNKWSFGFGVSGNGSLFGMRASTLKDIGLSNLGGNFKLDYLINKKWSIGFKLIYAGLLKDMDYVNISFSDPLNYSSVTFDKGYVSNSSITSTYYLIGNNDVSKRGLYITQGFGYAGFNTSETEFATYNHQSTGTGVKYGQGTFKHYDKQKSLSGLISLGADFSLWSGKLYVELPVSVNIYSERRYNVQSPDGPLLKKDKGFSLYGSSAFVNVGYAFVF